MRQENLLGWYSIDTGPSVFINTYTENAETIAKRLREIGFTNATISKVGGKPSLTKKHLF